MDTPNRKNSGLWLASPQREPKYASSPAFKSPDRYQPWYSKESILAEEGDDGDGGEYVDVLPVDLPPPTRYKDPVVKKNQGTRERGMKHLEQIVGSRNLNQRIRRAKGAYTKKGAERWIQKKNLKGYYVKTEDIDDDGIGDVIIYDKGGNRRVINGYMLSPSDLQYRQYFENLPDEERQKAKDYRQYFNDVYYKPSYDEYGRIKGYAVEPGSEADVFGDTALEKHHINHFKRIKPSRRTAYQEFSALCNEKFREILANPPEDVFILPPGMKVPATVLMKAVSAVWTHGVISSVLRTIFEVKNPDHHLNRDPKAFPTIRASPQFKEAVEDFVSEFESVPRDSEFSLSVQQAMYIALGNEMNRYKQSREYADKLAKLQQ